MTVEDDRQDSLKVPELHCTKCGTLAESSDLYCRSCGVRLPVPDEVHPIEPSVTREDAAAEPPSFESHSRSRLIAIGALGLIVAAAVLFFSGALGGSEPTQAERQKEQAAELKGPLQTAMRYRDSLLLAEREFLAASEDSRRALRRYQQRVAQVKAANKRISDANEPLYDACANGPVACPNPTYEDLPNIPDLSSSVKKFRTAATRLGRLNAEILSVTPPAELRGFYAQMSSAARSLEDDATYNADTITKAVSPGEPGEGDAEGGYVDRAQTKTLRDETALPAIRQLNREALVVVRKLGLSIASYDIPGGTDRDPADHSTLR